MQRSNGQAPLPTSQGLMGWNARLVTSTDFQCIVQATVAEMTFGMFGRPLWIRAEQHRRARLAHRRAATDRLRSNQEPSVAHTTAVELAPTVHHLRHVTVATTVYLYPSSSGQSLASVVPTRRLLLAASSANCRLNSPLRTPGPYALKGLRSPTLPRLLQPVVHIPIDVSQIVDALRSVCQSQKPVAFETQVHGRRGADLFRLSAGA